MIAVTLTRCEGKRFRLQALTVFTDTATVYSAEFSDSLSGAVGLARFLAMLRMLTKVPVQLTVKADIEDEAMKKVISGCHAPVRYDGRYQTELQNGAVADGSKDV